MIETTARFALPLLVPGQAQKEMSHNEALALIDAALHAGVVAAGVDTPPANPAVGACWIVGSSPGGAWIGHPRAIAAWSEAGWRFVPPREGLSAWVAGAGRRLSYIDGGWRAGPLDGDSLRIAGRTMLGASPAAIAAPAGGDTIDAPARTAIAAILTVLRMQGLTVPE